MRYILKLVFIFLLSYNYSLALDNNKTQTINYEDINNSLKILDKSLENNIWINKYKTYLAYRKSENNLMALKKKYKRYSLRSAKKYKELSYQLKNKIKIKENELDLISEYKESMIGHSIKPKDIDIAPKIKNPFNIIEAYTYIQKLDTNYKEYKKIYKQIRDLLKIINKKIELNSLLNKDVAYLKKQFIDFTTVIDIIETTSNIYERKVKQVTLEMKANIKAEIERTIKIFLMIFLLIIISILFKKGAKRYIRVDDNQYAANKLINFILIVIIIFILLFSYIENASYLVTVLGFASAGIAIALKEWFMSIFGWMAIMTSGAIKVGDRIKVTKDNTQIVGDVLDISLLKISLREDITLTSYEKNRRTGRVFFIPNNYIFTDLLSNYTYDEMMTVWDGIDINITFESNHTKAVQIAKNIVNSKAQGYTQLANQRLSKMKRKYILRNSSPEPRVFSFIEDYGIVISTWYHTNSYSTLGLRSTISMAILDAFKLEKDITIAYPTQTLKLSKNNISKTTQATSN